jgi:hypothetical protein
MFRRIVAVIVLSAGMASSASAALIALWRQNTITHAAISNDPSLASMQSWSLMVQNPENMGFWSSAGLRATLPSGSFFYRHPLGGFTRPSTDAIAANPALAFQTYVTSPRQSPSGANPPTIVSNWPQTSVPSFGGPSDPIPGTFTVAWGDAQAGAGPVLGGPFEIARITFPLGVIPDVLTAKPVASFAEQLDPSEMTPIPKIPEPRTTALCIVMAGLRRRWR